MARALRAMAGAAGAAALGFVAYWSLRLAWADQLASSGRPAPLARAAGLAAGNAAYLARWAEALQLAGGDAQPVLARAVSLNPADAGLWIRLGLEAERRGEFARAERCLLASARASRHYEPRWALANYFFRRGNTVEFQRWARSALELAYGDPKPLFQLAWHPRPDAGFVLEHVIPPRPAIEASYLHYLIAEKRLEAAGATAQRLAAHAGSADPALLLEGCNRLLAAGLAVPALALWNALCRQGTLPYSPLEPQSGASLTNAAFRFPPLGAGFDWRVDGVEGVRVARASPAGLRVSFSGDQPERCEALSQLLPLVAGRRYRLRFQYGADTIEPAGTLAWRISAGESELAGADWKAGELRLSVPSGTGLVRLALVSERKPGLTRTRGSLSLSGVQLEGEP